MKNDKDLRSRVEVLKVVQIGASRIFHFERYSLTGRATKSGNGVTVARRHHGDTEVRLNPRGAAEGGLGSGRRLKLGKVNCPISAKAEGRSLEVLFLGKKEDQSTLLARVALRNVKVEDGRGCRRNSTVECSTWRCGWGR